MDRWTQTQFLLHQGFKEFAVQFLDIENSPTHYKSHVFEYINNEQVLCEVLYETFESLNLVVYFVLKWPSS